MRVVISNEIKIIDFPEWLLEYCQDKLSIDNPEFEKKIRKGYYIGDTPAVLNLYRVDGNALIIPTGSGKLLRGIATKKNSIVDLADNPRNDYKLLRQLTLYDYQDTAVSAMLKHSCGILQSPCGSGKTQMGIAMAIRTGAKCLWLTHTKDLLTQSYDRAKQYIDEKLLGTITSGKINIGRGITFATVQTLSKQDLSQYKYSFDMIIVDECHRCSGTPTQVTMFSKVINAIAARCKYGLSATVHRSDNLIRTCTALLGDIVYRVPEAAVEDKTMQVTVLQYNINSEIDIDDYTDAAGMLDYVALIKCLVNDVNRNKIIVSQINDYKGHSQLVLSDRLDHLEQIKQLLIDSGYDIAKIRFINGKMTSKKAKGDRIQAIEDMRTGKADILLATYTLAKEGLDIPVLDRLHLALPKKDYAVVTQSIGRIGRKAEGKTDAIAIDYVDNIGYCLNAFKKRKTSYRKKGCKIIVND